MKRGANSTSGLAWDLEFKQGHFPPLDGTRGLAVLMVLGFHLFNFPPLSRFVGFGWSGVDLFFVLSGLLITGILIDSRDTQRRYTNFIARRALRIFPLYYLSLGGFFAYVVWTESRELGYLLDNQLYFWTYTQNFLFCIKGWDQQPAALNHFWSLAIEEQFYLLWPLVVFRLGNRGIVMVALAGIAMSVSLRNIVMSLPACYILTPLRLDGLLVGAICAVLIRDYRELAGRVGPPLFMTSAVLVPACVLVAGTQKFTGEPFLRWGILALDVFFGCLLLSVFDKGRWGRLVGGILSISWLTWCGRYAYGIYVYHWILQCVFQADIARTFKQAGLGVSMANLATALVLTATVLALSVVSYRYLEAAFLRLKTRFQ